MIYAIVAADEAWGIGCNNKLLCSIPNDLKRFKSLTTGNVVIMGKNTFKSIGSVPLPERTNIVVTHDYLCPVTDKNGVIFMSMNEVIHYLHSHKHPDGFTTLNVFIIGGESIYKQLLEYCDYVLLTRIKKTFNEADTFFPNIDENPQWEITDRITPRLSGDIPWEFVTYKRIKSK